MPIGGTAFYGQNQSPRITTNYLNQLNRFGDPAPGVPVSTAQASGSIVQPYAGQVGGKLSLTGPWAATMGDPAVGPLYGGLYMYLQLNNAGAQLTRGQILYWLNEPNYVVTLTAAGNKLAGIALNRTLPGNWDWFQVAGIASVLFGAPVAVNAIAAASQGGGNSAGVPALGATVIDATYLGPVVLTAGVAGQVSPVELNLAVGMNF